MRLAAATLVIYSHSYALVGLKEPASHNQTLGSIAVDTFFVISGLLIAASWQNHARVAVFLGKRLLRIMPALIVVILVSVFVIGPVFTSLPLKAYFENNQTYAYLNGISLFGMTDNLPGVFAANKYTSINGSLWTLPCEFVAYLTIAFLGKTNLLRKNHVAIIGWAGFVALYFITRHTGNWLVIFNMAVYRLVPLLAFFFAGVVLYVYRNKIKLMRQLALLSVALLLIPLPWTLMMLTQFIALPYLIVYIGSMTWTKFNRLERYGDFSYGTYVFAWPIQQIIIDLYGGNIGHKRLFVLATLSTLMVAMTSWYLVEKPMLKLKLISTPNATHFCLMLGKIKFLKSARKYAKSARPFVSMNI